MGSQSALRRPPVLVRFVAAAQSGKTRLAQTIGILLSDRRQLSSIEIISSAPAPISGLTEKRRAALATVFFDTHAGRVNESTPHVSSAAQ
jgi:hypothetical protein